MRTRSKVHRRRKQQQSDIRLLLRRLAGTCEHPARLAELYYWSREPQLAEIMRQIVSMSDDARSILHAFFKLVEGDPNSVTAVVNGNGDLTLSAPAVEDLLAMLEPPSKGEKTAQPLH